MAVQYIDDDFVAVYRGPRKASGRRVTLAFGDPVEVLSIENGWTKVRVTTYFDKPFEGFIQGENVALRDDGVLRLSMVDVQQGDGLVLETPAGEIMFIDGGDNKLFARHVAARFRHRRGTADDPVEIAAILISHGDADHFDGLNDIRRSETLPGYKAHKRLFIHPRRVLHNGLVKVPSRRNGRRVSDRDLFGRTLPNADGRLCAVDLYDDPRDAPPENRNRPFSWWTDSLDHWAARGPIDVRRVDFETDPADAFNFLHAEGITAEIQGPFTEEVVDPDTGQSIPALPFLHEPEPTPVEDLEHPAQSGGSVSASHTINGHSIALRLTYGNVRFNLTGDLNAEAMRTLRERIPEEQLEAEIVKAPHHGSHDFDLEALRAMKPVVAIISSGDESEMKEYIHPRATVLAALGGAMRGDKGVVFSTELAAFFETRDECYRREDLADFFKANKEKEYTGEELRKLFSGMPRDEDPPGLFFGFERTNFGIVHVRTDGERVLAFTHSGREHLNEAYRFHVTMENGERKVRFRPVVTG